MCDVKYRTNDVPGRWAPSGRADEVRDARLLPSKIHTLPVRMISGSERDLQADVWRLFKIGPVDRENVKASFQIGDGVFASALMSYSLYEFHRYSHRSKP